MLRIPKYQNNERLDQREELVYKLFSDSLITFKDYNAVVNQEIKREDAAAEQKASATSATTASATKGDPLNNSVVFIFSQPREPFLSRLATVIVLVPALALVLVLVLALTTVKEAIVAVVASQRPYPQLVEDLVPLIRR